MTDDNDRIYVEEFKKYSGFYLAKILCTQEELAGNLGIDATYLSKMMSGARPVSRKVLKNIKKLCQEIDNKSTTPEKISVQENLPLHPNPIMERIAKLEALVDQDHKEKNELLERVAVLAKDLERTKIDSEKKIRGIVAEAIRDEAERIAAELSDRPAGRREAANG